MNKSLVWSYRNRLMMNTITIWNSNLRELQNLEENSDIAVWHWSIKFQIKAIQAWRSYTKKEKLLKHQKEIEIIERQKQVQRNVVKTKANSIVVNCTNFADSNIYLHQEKTIFNCYVYFIRWRDRARVSGDLLYQTEFRPRAG